MGRKIEISFTVCDPSDRSATAGAYAVLPGVGDTDPAHARMVDKVQNALDRVFDRSGNGTIVIDIDDGTATVEIRS